MTLIAIIGFSGRNPADKLMLKSHHFTYMLETILAYIETELKLDTIDVTLVSGGSAWCDHLAVRLAIENNFKGLDLYLPCDIDYTTGKFINQREASVLNDLHASFNKVTATNSATDFLTVISAPSTKVTVKKGFLNRNKLIADNCDYLIAFTSNLPFPTTGGTNDTWNKCKHAKKVHFTLAYY